MAASLKALGVAMACQASATMEARDLAWELHCLERNHQNTRSARLFAFKRRSSASRRVRAFLAPAVQSLNAAHPLWGWRFEGACPRPLMPLLRHPHLAHQPDRRLDLAVMADGVTLAHGQTGVPREDVWRQLKRRGYRAHHGLFGFSLALSPGWQQACTQVPLELWIAGAPSCCHSVFDALKPKDEPQPALSPVPEEGAHAYV